MPPSDSVSDMNVSAKIDSKVSNSVFDKVNAFLVG